MKSDVLKIILLALGSAVAAYALMTAMGTESEARPKDTAGSETTIESSTEEPIKDEPQPINETVLEKEIVEGHDEESIYAPPAGSNPARSYEQNIIEPPMETVPTTTSAARGITTKPPVPDTINDVFITERSSTTRTETSTTEKGVEELIVEEDIGEETLSDTSKIGSESTYLPPTVTTRLSPIRYYDIAIPV